MDDMDARGRRRAIRKLTDEQVIEIRSRWDAGGVKLRDLATDFDVHPNAIWQIVHRRVHRHVG